MGMSKLNIWVRDTAHPCLPYQSTMHTWVAGIFTCDLQPVWVGLLTEPWSPPPVPGEGVKVHRVHQQVEVPPGCYIVLGAAPCKNVYTDFAMVQVGCNEEVCVNLLPKSVSTCSGLLVTALNMAKAMGAINYSFGCPAGQEIPERVISSAVESLENLRKYIPEDPITPKLAVVMDELKKAEKGMQQK